MVINRLHDEKGKKKRRRNSHVLYEKHASISCFLSGMLFCTESGGMYGPKVMHSNDAPTRRTLVTSVVS